MKRLLIRVGDTVMFDGDVSEVQFCEGMSEVSVKGSFRRGGGKSGGAALLDILAAAKAKREPVPAEPEVFEPSAVEETVAPDG